MPRSPAWTLCSRSTPLVHSRWNRRRPNPLGSFLARPRRHRPSSCPARLPPPIKESPPRRARRRPPSPPDGQRRVRVQVRVRPPPRGDRSRANRENRTRTRRRRPGWRRRRFDAFLSAHVEYLGNRQYRCVLDGKILSKFSIMRVHVAKKYAGLVHQWAKDRSAGIAETTAANAEESAPEVGPSLSPREPPPPAGSAPPPPASPSGTRVFCRRNRRPRTPRR